MKLRIAFTTFAFLYPTATLAVDIHPLCIEKMEPLHSSASENAASVDLESCTDKYQKYPFTKKGKWQAVWNRNEMKAQPVGESLPVYSSYNLIGELENSQVLLHQVVNYGGSGTFTNAMLIKGISLADSRPHSSSLEVTGSIPGGDRCMGGINELSITSPDTVLVSRKITTAELVRYGQNKANAHTVSAGLPDCAICCIGTAQESWSLSGKYELTGISLAPRERSNGESRKTKCLYDLLRGEDDVRLELTKSELVALQQEYISQCLKPGSSYTP